MWVYVVLSVLLSSTFPTRTNADSAQVHVRAASHISIHAIEKEAKALTLLLRDNRQVPIAFVPIALLSADDGVRARSHTDEHGLVRFDDLSFTSSLSARFDGNASYAASTLVFGGKRAPERTALKLVSSDLWTLDRPYQEIRVDCPSHPSGGATRIIVSTPNVARLAMDACSAGGPPLVIRIDSQNIETTGPLEVSVAASRQGQRISSQTLKVTAVLPTEVAVARASVSMEGSKAIATVSGTLRTPRSPLAGAPVGIYLGEQHLKTVETDQAGLFSSEIAMLSSVFSRLENEPLVLRYAGRAEHFLPSRSETSSFGLTDNSKHNLELYGSALLTLVCVAVLALVRQRSKEARKEKLRMWQSKDTSDVQTLDTNVLGTVAQPLELQRARASQAMLRAIGLIANKRGRPPFGFPERATNETLCKWLTDQGCFPLGTEAPGLTAAELIHIWNRVCYAANASAQEVAHINEVSQSLVKASDHQVPD